MQDQYIDKTTQAGQFHPTLDQCENNVIRKSSRIGCQENTLQSSIDCFLRDKIKALRDEAFRLEALQREIPTWSQPAANAFWDMITK